MDNFKKFDGLNASISISNKFDTEHNEPEYELSKSIDTQPNLNIIEEDSMYFDKIFYKTD